MVPQPPQAGLFLLCFVVVVGLFVVVVVGLLLL